MDTEKRRKYTETFKLETLALLERSGKSMSQLERELGIGSGQLWRWRRQYRAVEKGNGETHLELNELEAAKAEIRRLQRELAEVQEEREILKKAVNIFSRRNA